MLVLIQIIVKIDLARYKYVDLDIDRAKMFLEKMREKFGSIRDIDESFRYIENFDEFFNLMKKKFKEFLALPHTPDDYIKSKVVIDKIRLYKSDSGKRVVFVLDRRVDRKLIEDLLKSIGYEKVVFEKLF